MADSSSQSNKRKNRNPHPKHDGGIDSKKTSTKGTSGSTQNTRVPRPRAVISPPITFPDPATVNDGRGICGCQATKHHLATNCVKCGYILCTDDIRRANPADDLSSPVPSIVPIGKHAKSATAEAAVAASVAAAAAAAAERVAKLPSTCPRCMAVCPPIVSADELREAWVARANLSASLIASGSHVNSVKITLDRVGEIAHASKGAEKLSTMVEKGDAESVGWVAALLTSLTPFSTLPPPPPPGGILSLEDGSSLTTTTGDAAAATFSAISGNESGGPYEQFTTRVGSSVSRSENVPLGVTSGAEAAIYAAYAQRDRLLRYDRESAQRTTVLDAQADYYSSNAAADAAVNDEWMEEDERVAIRERLEKRKAAHSAGRFSAPLRVTYDLSGRKLLSSTTSGKAEDDNDVSTSVFHNQSAMVEETSTIGAGQATLDATRAAIRQELVEEATAGIVMVCRPELDEVDTQEYEEDNNVTMSSRTDWAAVAAAPPPPAIEDVDMENFELELGNGTASEYYRAMRANWAAIAAKHPEKTRTSSRQVPTLKVQLDY